MRTGGPQPLEGASQFTEGERFVVNQTRADELIGLWPHMVEEPIDKRLALAIRRLSNSRLRLRDEDKILDYWIALEALFMNENDELSLRASLRISRWLGIDANDRLRIFNESKESYGVRSRFAHGETVEHNKLQRMTIVTGEILRMALRRSILENARPNIANIDISLHD